MAASSVLSCVAQPASCAFARAKTSSFMGEPVIRSAPLTLRRSQCAVMEAAGPFQSGPSRTAKDQGASTVPKATATEAAPSTKAAPVKLGAASADVPTSAMPSQYYLRLADALGADVSGFQALKAPVSLGTTSDTLWQQMDRIPSKIMFGTPGGKGNFHQVYKAIVLALKAGDDGSAFEADMGDQMSDWNTYKKTVKGAITPAAFNTWADKFFNDNASTVEADFLSMYNDTINAAKRVVVDAKNFAKLYETDIAALRQMVAGGSAVNFSFDNETASDDYSSAYAHTDEDDRFLWWGHNTSTTATTLSDKIAHAKVTVQVSFGKMVSVPASPETTWFDSSVISTALNGDSTVWSDPNSLTNFFGNGVDQEGQLPRVVSSIYVVQGPFKITTTMEADWSDDERTFFQQNTSGGFWPFYSNSSTTKNTVDVSSSKTQIVATTFDPDSTALKVLGAQISDIKSAFS